MMHVTRGGGSMTSGRSSRKRAVALLATFFLLMVGMVVSFPGLMNANASSNTYPATTDDNDNNDGHDDGHHDGHDDGDDEGHDGDHEHQVECANEDQHDNEGHDGDADNK